MLCCVCLLEERDVPAKAVTYVQGTSVCREHVTTIGWKKVDTEPSPAVEAIKKMVLGFVAQQASQQASTNGRGIGVPTDK